MKKLLIFVMLISTSVSGVVQAQALFTEGKDYKKITEQPTDSGDKIEILEFFWYGCPHCYQFEPRIQSWKKTKPKNVVFKRVPAVFRPIWKIHARMYYALQVLGVGEKLHTVIFDAMHKEKLKLDKEEDVVNFLAKHGVDKKEFKEVYSSFSIDQMVRKANKQSKAYGLSGVPTIGVNGKYVITGPMAVSYENLIKIMDYLILKESAAAK